MPFIIEPTLDRLFTLDQQGRRPHQGRPGRQQLWSEPLPETEARLRLVQRRASELVTDRAPHSISQTSRLPDISIATITNSMRCREG